MIQVFPTNFPPANTPLVNSQGVMTTPGMSFFRALFNRTGQENGLVNQVDLNVSANIIADWNFIPTGAPTFPDINLPALTGGQAIVVQVGTGGTNIHAPSGATIDGAAFYALPANKMQIFWFFSDTQIFSTQLG